jgi:mannose-1-phosphate guanylyltransferase
MSFIDDVYSESKNISIDYGIMEKADNVFVLCSEFGWADLGTWGSLYENRQKDLNKNSILGDKVFTYNTKNCIVNMPNDKLVILQGLEDHIVVESDGILLICKREDEQEIKQYVNEVKLKLGNTYL